MTIRSAGRSAGRSAVLAMIAVAMMAVPAQAAPLGSDAAGRFAELALACVAKEYPNHLSHTLASDADVKPPRDLTPAFFGCLDWHSAVHGHWLLARLSRLDPDATFAGAARAALAVSLTTPKIAGEVAYLRGAGRASFERPYGLAWALALGGELRRLNDDQGRAWAAAYEPLELEAAERLKAWLPKLTYPIRIGEHAQTAFAFGLAWDWAQQTGDQDLSALLADAARRFYAQDKACPLAYEPGGQDFLSPCLAEADFMRRVLPPAAFARFLTKFLPQVPTGTRQAPWLTPAIVSDRADPKLAHLDGLNLSRAWMLEGIAAGLPRNDPRIQALLAASQAHGQAALPAVTGEHYEGGHWLGTFATYLTSRAGLDQARSISRMER